MNTIARPVPATTAALVFAAFAATVPAANWLIQNVGVVCVPDGPCLVPIAPGVMAPSGVLVVGLALVLRDWLHELAGRWWAAVAVLTGGVLSGLVAPGALVVASVASFIVAEGLDLLVYDRLRRRGLALAVLGSGAVGAAVDSALFLWLAFGSLEFVAGHALGKLYASAAVAAALWARRL